MREFIETAMKELPDFIDEAYPKGDMERGPSTTSIVRFLLWLARKSKIKIDKL